MVFMIISKCKKLVQIFPELNSDFSSDLDSTQTWTLLIWVSKRDSKYCDSVNTVSCKLLTIKHPVNNNVFVQIILGFSFFLLLRMLLFSLKSQDIVKATDASAARDVSV